ncbi:MAG: TOBE domain-containing protein, partial [Acidobacteriota bacterium]
VKLGIRPEHMLLTEPGAGAFSGDIDVVEELGESHLVHVIVPHGERIVVRVAGDAKVKEGETVGISFDQNDAHLFRADGIALPRTGPMSTTAPVTH